MPKEADQHRQQTQSRQEEAWKLRVQGWTQDRIAEHMGISQPAISKLLAKTEKRLHAEFAAQAEEIKARQTAQIEHLYDRLADQFEESCRDGGGNPALLAQALKALADVRAIWGLNAAERREVSGPNGGPIQIDAEGIRDELNRKLARLAAGDEAEGVSAKPDAGRTGGDEV